MLLLIQNPEHGHCQVAVTRVIYALWKHLFLVTGVTYLSCLVMSRHIFSKLQPSCSVLFVSRFCYKISSKSNKRNENEKRVITELCISCMCEIMLNMKELMNVMLVCANLNSRGLIQYLLKLFLNLFLQNVHRKICQIYEMLLNCSFAPMFVIILRNTIVLASWKYFLVVLHQCS